MIEELKKIGMVLIYGLASFLGYKSYLWMLQNASEFFWGATMATVGWLLFFATSNMEE